MTNDFRVVVADDVQSDEIFVELWLDNKLILEVLPKGNQTVLSLWCKEKWVETDLASFIEALNKCITRADQIAEPINKELL